MAISLDRVEPDLRQRVGRVLIIGKGRFWVASADRDNAEQVKLWNAWQAGIRKYGSEEAAMRAGVARAAPPGKSKHEKRPAEAVDVGCPNTREDRDLRRWAARECGLITPIDGEPWHMEKNPNAKPLPPLQIPTI